MEETAQKSEQFNDEEGATDEIVDLNTGNRGDEGLLEGVVIKESDEILSDSEDEEVSSNHLCNRLPSFSC